MCISYAVGISCGVQPAKLICMLPREATQDVTTRWLPSAPNAEKNAKNCPYGVLECYHGIWQPEPLQKLERIHGDTLF